MFVGIAVDFAIQFSVRYREYAARRSAIRSRGMRQTGARGGRADPVRRAGHRGGVPRLRADRVFAASRNSA